MAVWKFTEAVLRGHSIDVYNHGDMLRDFTLSMTSYRASYLRSIIPLKTMAKRNPGVF